MASRKFVSSAEAAKKLNVSLRTIQLWVEKGILTAWKTPGGHRRIVFESLQKMLDEQDTKSRLTQDKFKVVIVEDDAQQRKLYGKFFSKWSQLIDLNLMEDGFQGLLKVGEVKPDLLITDLMMPAMDGIQMINAIKEQEQAKDLGIIVITAMDQDSAAVMQLRAEGITVLQKPVSFAELKRSVISEVSLPFEME